jgi:hypothetical protein
VQIGSEVLKKKFQLRLGLNNPYAFFSAIGVRCTKPFTQLLDEDAGHPWW